MSVLLCLCVSVYICVCVSLRVCMFIYKMRLGQHLLPIGKVVAELILETLQSIWCSTPTVLLGRKFQDYEPVTVKERSTYFQLRMVSNLEGILQVVVFPGILLDGRGGRFGR